MEESESESMEINSQALEEVVKATYNNVTEGLDEAQALNMALLITDLCKKKGWFGDILLNLILS